MDLTKKIVDNCINVMTKYHKKLGREVKPLGIQGFYSYTRKKDGSKVPCPLVGFEVTKGGKLLYKTIEIIFPNGKFRNYGDFQNEQH